MMKTDNETNKGILFAILAYVIWGITPLYFAQLRAVPAYEILAHRAIWSFFVIAALLSLLKLWPQVKRIFQRPKTIGLLCVTAILISINWLTYIWAVNNGHLLDASLGYFINPIVNVILGMLFLAEKLRKWQWTAVAFAVTGVTIQIVTFGSLPWIALVLSCSFGLYGLLRKKLHINALVGLLIETLFMLPIAGLYLFGLATTPTADLMSNPASLNILLLLAGIITTVPLLCFNNAAIRLPLSTLGFFQYIGPSIMFVLGVYWYGETVSPDKLVTFSFIWAALLIFSLDGITQNRKQRLLRP